MSVTASKKRPKIEAIDAHHKVAVRKLIQEIRRDYAAFIKGGMQLDSIFAEWSARMNGLREVERQMMDYRLPGADLQSHGELTDLMIQFCATIGLAAERHLSHRPLLNGAAKPFLHSQAALIQKHRKILEFEFKGWHGPLSRGEVEDLSERIPDFSLQTLLELYSEYQECPDDEPRKAALLDNYGNEVARTSQNNGYVPAGHIHQLIHRNWLDRRRENSPPRSGS